MISGAALRRVFLIISMMWLVGNYILEAIGPRGSYRERLSFLCRAQEAAMMLLCGVLLSCCHVGGSCAVRAMFHEEQTSYYQTVIGSFAFKMTYGTEALILVPTHTVKGLCCP